VELRFWGGRGGGGDVAFGAGKAFEVFEEDFDAGEIVGFRLVELVGEVVDPGAAEGHGGYCWLVGNCCMR